MYLTPGINLNFDDAKLYQDYAKLYQIVSSMEEVTQVQNSINDSVEWSIIWEMFFNFKKCKHMHLGYPDMEQTCTMKKGQDYPY